MIEGDKNPREVCDLEYRSMPMDQQCAKLRLALSASDAIQSGYRSWCENALTSKIGLQVLGYLVILAEDFPIDTDDTRNGHCWRKTVV